MKKAWKRNSYAEGRNAYRKKKFTLADERQTSGYNQPAKNVATEKYKTFQESKN